MKAEMYTDDRIMEKSMRSVFVGNIPYEATEEKLKDIFGEVGQVLSFKLVFDRETGKPKGYGFCEYRDKETAGSAMRNLNGYEIGGRNLRVDNACTEKSRMEMQNLINQTPVESPYGDPLPPEEVPEAISKVVASMPPEQMFELIKQMKDCMQSNPTEARNMLLQNPQLSYALLQVLVIMKVVDPLTACSMLHPQTPVPVLNIFEKKKPGLINISNPSQIIPIVLPNADVPVAVPPMIHSFQQQQPPFINQDVDLRSIDTRILGDSRLLSHLGNDLDIGTVPGISPNPLLPGTNKSYRRNSDFGPVPIHQPLSHPIHLPDPRHKLTQSTLLSKPLQPIRLDTPANDRIQANVSSGNGSGVASDQEKTALIMQVLRLSDDQIALLPAEQRNSILVLKEQIMKSSQSQR